MAKSTIKLRPSNPKGGSRGLTEEQLIEALRKHAGNVMSAAAALGITEGAIYDRMRNHPHLAKIREDVRERVVDMAEARFLKRLERDEWPAVKLALTTLGRKRGYATRTELTGADGAPLPTAAPVTVNFTALYVEPKPEEDVV